MAQRLLIKKIKKQEDEKQVVFWREKYAKRAKAEREAAKMKARDLAENPGNYTRTTSYGAAKYVKKIDYDKETGEILASSSILSLDEEKIREEEALDGYYMLLTSEMEASDDEIIDMYRGLWRIEESFRIMKSQLDARPVYLQKEDTITGHFLICYLAVLLTRLLQFKVLGDQYCSEDILNFFKQFRAARVSERKYINLTRNSTFIREFAQKTELPLTSYFLTESQIKKMLSHRF